MLANIAHGCCATISARWGSDSSSSACLGRGVGVLGARLVSAGSMATYNVFIVVNRACGLRLPELLFEAIAHAAPCLTCLTHYLCYLVCLATCLTHCLCYLVSLATLAIVLLPLLPYRPSRAISIARATG